MGRAAAPELGEVALSTAIFPNRIYPHFIRGSFWFVHVEFPKWKCPVIHRNPAF
jgi:hypothetical protein